MRFLFRMIPAVTVLAALVAAPLNYTRNSPVINNVVNNVFANTPTASDWPQWQKDEKHTGYSETEFTLRPPLSIAWRTYLGSPVWGQVIVDGIVYVSTDNARLYAIDSTTGRQLWMYQSDRTHISSPAIANGVVYVAAGWAPTRDTVKLIAINTSTGVVQWEQLITDYGSTCASTPTLSGGVVYVGGCDRALHAFNAATGVRLWRTGVANGIVATPSVADGRVFAGVWDGGSFGSCSGGGIFYAFDAITGTVLWNRCIGGALWGSSSVSGTAVYIGGGIGDHLALSVENGQTIWHATSYDAGNGNAAVANGMVYIGANAGTLYAYDAISGALRWSYQTGGQIAGGNRIPHSGGCQRSCVRYCS